MGPDEVLGSREVLWVVAIDGALLARGALWTRGIQMRNAVLPGGNALPKDNPPDVTRCKSANDEARSSLGSWAEKGAQDKENALSAVRSSNVEPGPKAGGPPRLPQFNNPISATK